MSNWTPEEYGARNNDPQPPPPDPFSDQPGPPTPRIHFQEPAPANPPYPPHNFDSPHGQSPSASSVTLPHDQVGEDEEKAPLTGYGLGGYGGGLYPPRFVHQSNHQVCTTCTNGCLTIFQRYRF
jgi:hypothetical protein